MRIKEKYIVITTLTVMILGIGYWIWFENKNIDFQVDEYFADSSYNGKIYFSFVSVDKYDVKQMFDYAKSLSTENLTLDMLRRDLPLITIVHFYKKSDSSQLDQKLIEQIQRQYPHISNVSQSLQCVRNGYIYTGFSKYIHKLKIPKDTIFKTTVIIPKNGIKAQNILKVKKSKSTKLEKNKDSLRKENGNN